MKDSTIGVAGQVREAVTCIRKQDSRQPEVGIILGSGLSQLAEDVADAIRIPYDQIPDFPRTGVAGHSGEIVIGSLSDKTVALLNGRVHFYEGHDLVSVTFPVRVLHGLGCQTLIVTNAAGGLNPEFRSGDLMLIEDHINLLGLSGNNPLRGLRDPELGETFVDMSAAYDPELRRLALVVARRDGQELRRGVYVMVAGPSYETPAETRFLRIVGGDAVGMSTAAEVTAARQCGLRVLGISCLTNMATGEEHEHLNHQAVLDTAQIVSLKLARIIRGVLGEMP